MEHAAEHTGYRQLGSCRRPRRHGRTRHHRSLSIHSHGFTLVELLVVISIVALLLAIFLPVLSRVRKQARGVVCQVTLRQWGTVLSTYVADYQGQFPHGNNSTVWMLSARKVHVPVDTTDTFSPDGNSVREFHPIRTKGMVCPSAAKPYDGPTPTGFGVAYVTKGMTWKFAYIEGTTFRAWDLIEPGPELPVSYGLNRWLFDVPLITSLTPSPSYTEISSVRYPAGTPLLLDCRAPYGLPGGDTLEPPEAEDDMFWPFRMAPLCINRHNGAVNGLFLDWSVRKVDLKELWTLKWHPSFDTHNEWTQAGGVTPETWPSWMRRFKDY